MRKGQRSPEQPLTRGSQTIQLGLKKPESTVSPEPEQVARQQVVPAVEATGQAAVSQEDGPIPGKPRVSFAYLLTQEVSVRGEYFLDYLSESLPIIESMTYLDAYNFTVLVAREFRFTHSQTLELLEKFQRENKIVPAFQIIIQLYEAYVDSREASPVEQIRRTCAVLVRLFQAPLLRRPATKLEVIEIARRVFGFTTSQGNQLRSEFLD